MAKAKPSPATATRTPLRAVRVTIDNRPGALSVATRTLADHDVNLEGVEVEVLGNSGFFRFYTKDADRAAKVLREAGYIVTLHEILEVVLPNKPGELARVCETLAKSAVNIESCFGTGDREDEISFFFRVNDPVRAHRLLKEAKFRAYRHTHEGHVHP